MATLVDLSGYAYGIETAETSVEVKSFVVTTAPDVKEYARDRVNNRKGFAVTNSRQEITLEGELSATSAGVLAFTFSTTCALANDKDYYGVTTGDVYLDSATISQTFDGFKSVSLQLSRDPDITGNGA